MITPKFLQYVLLSGSMLAGLTTTAVYAADYDAGPLPAVSSVNGKLEFGAGMADIENFNSDGLFFGGAAISIPLGETFGLQADFSVVDAFNETAVGGATHLFTRDPSKYLVGVIGGYSDFGTGDTLWGGAEAELYLDNISIEAVAGVMNFDVANSKTTEYFAVGDVALYATDDLRLSVGASSIAGFQSAGVGMEWKIGNLGLPVSFTADARMGEDDFVAAKAGFTIYFGGDTDKSLKDRHRQDDPRIRSFIGGSGIDLFGAGGGVLGDACDAPTDGGGGEATLAFAKKALAAVPVDGCGNPIYQK
jgi:hypothetical protein